MTRGRQHSRFTRIMKNKTAIPTAAIILAAGKGTRMKSDLPKVLHPVGNQPMVRHVLASAADAGLDPLLLVIAPGMHKVASVGADFSEDVKTATQEEQLGTAHAVLSAKDALGGFEGNLVVLYGDTPLIRPETVTRLLDALNKDARCAIAVLGFTPDDPADYGRLVVDNKGALTAIVEAKDASAEQKKIRLCNSGVIALRGGIAWELLEAVDNKNAKGEYYLTDVVGLAVARGLHAVAVEADAQEVLGVNSRVDLAVADASFQQRRRHEAMLSGVTLQSPETVYFSADTELAPDVFVEPNVYFGPRVVIGSGAHIKAFSHLEGSVVGEHSVVGPFARLRPGTNLGEKVKIGNFVEIKKSEIEDGAKISHLSYIGDASIGADANIGAGTITCNYDGYNKYRTVIGAEAFIGSNTALVAPVTVGAGAMVAAGSVITEDIEDNALALARPRQEQKADWAKSFRDKQKKS